MTHTLLRIDASARTEGSVTRDLGDRIAARLAPTRTLARDLTEPLPQLDAAWIGANFTAAADRAPEQQAALALSDALIAELQAADTLLIGVPVYNFGIPASLKAWIDLVARAGVTFRYTEAGPEGLLKNKRAILAVASGGTGVGSEIDHATPYLKHVLTFLGITDIEVIAADRLALDPEATLAAAHEEVDRLAA